MGLSGAAAEAGAGNSVFAQGGPQGSMVGQGALLSAPRGSGPEGGAGGGAAEGGAAAGGCVALWSLKNQFYPVWSFSTKSGEHKGCCMDSGVRGTFNAGLQHLAYSHCKSPDAAVHRVQPHLQLHHGAEQHRTDTIYAEQGVC